MFRNKDGSVFYLGLVAAVFLVLSASRAFANDSIEVLLGQVFIPEHGYGTNNSVQLTLDGYLPNSCYQLGKYRIDTSADGRTFSVHQFADVEKNGVCAEGQVLPDHLSNLVPYTYDVALGHLAAGDYKIVFNETSSMPRSRVFHVYSSKNLTADDFPYAAVSTISMPDVVNGANPLNIVLTGSLTSSCSFVSDVKVSYEDDVIVVQPVSGYRANTLCTQMLMPFSRKVNIGKLGEGRFLVHVRSMSGKSVSHAFSVLTPDP